VDSVIAMIPAMHIDSTGHRSVSLQIISDSGAWWLEYPETQFQAAQNNFHVRLEQRKFICFARCQQCRIRMQDVLEQL